MIHYDAIILGTGGVGSAAAYHLARRGAKVLGIDRFQSGHDRGSSHGETRIIRQAYFEHPDYVPLLLRAYDLWRELEQLTGKVLLRQVGLLQIGPPDGAVVKGVLKSAQLHGLSVEQLSAHQIRRLWRGFGVPYGYVGVCEPQAGYLFVERCVLTHLAEAEAYGAHLRCGHAVQGWHSDGRGVTVELDDGKRISAGKLVITAGPWAPRILSCLDVKFEIRRKHAYWFPPLDRTYREEHCPAFLYETPSGVFYGFPQIDGLGVKLAEHSGGQVISDPLGDPRAFDAGDFRRVLSFARENLIGIGWSLRRRSVCFYTMSPDEHFIVDRHPLHENVLFAAGLSGHGFKFTSVLGEALADLALNGRTRLPIEFLSLSRLRP